MKFFATPLLMLVSSLSFSECYVVGELEGYATRKNDDYKLSIDGMSKQKFMIQISGDTSSVTPSDISCSEIGFNTLMCASITNEATSMELWTVYPNDGKAILVKTRTGLGAFDGGFIFVGSILGTCGK